jgi:hypothetical protein
LNFINPILFVHVCVHFHSKVSCCVHLFLGVKCPSLCLGSSLCLFSTSFWGWISCLC